MNEYVEIAPSVFLFDNFIDNCQEIIDAAFKKIENKEIKEATIINSNSLVVEKNIRDVLTIDLSPSYQEDIIWWILAQKIWRCADKYAITNYVSFSRMESPQFLYYPKDKGFYKTHIDSDRMMPRVFSAILYLNDVELGGETYFEKFNIEIKPLAGRLLLFPSNFVYIHSAKIPKSSEKYCIVTWFVP